MKKLLILLVIFSFGFWLFTRIQKEHQKEEPVEFKIFTKSGDSLIVNANYYKSSEYCNGEIGSYYRFILNNVPIYSIRRDSVNFIVKEDKNE